MPLGNFRLGNPPPNFQNPNFSGQPNWLNMGQTVLRGAQRVMPYLNQAGIRIPPGINLLMKGLGAAGMGGGINSGYPQQGFPQQGIPQQTLPQQGIPQQGYPSQGFFQQGFPPQSYQQRGGIFNNTLNVQPTGQFQAQPQFLAQPQLQSQTQVITQQVPQTPAKSRGIKALISNFLARRKG